MKAMILAAGLGTRLRPITDSRPKALVEVGGKPLLEHILNRLTAAGVSEVIINLHHFPEQIRAFVAEKESFGIRIEFSHETILLDTGGGLKQAAAFFDDDQPFILHNVDILTNLDLNKMIARHTETRSLATLAVNQRQTTRYFLFDEKDQLCGWESLKEPRRLLVRAEITEPRRLAFCGIHVISPEIFSKMNETGVFSIVEVYLRLAAAGERIKAFRADGFEWRDVGKLAEIK